MFPLYSLHKELLGSDNLDVWIEGSPELSPPNAGWTIVQLVGSHLV